MNERKLEELSRQEKSLLMFFETRCVDYGGTVDSRHMNDEDREIAARWEKEGFIEQVRICHEDSQRLQRRHWVKLSDEAWRLAHEERKSRAAMMWANWTWKTPKGHRDAERKIRKWLGWK